MDQLLVPVIVWLVKCVSIMKLSSCTVGNVKWIGIFEEMSKIIAKSYSWKHGVDRDFRRNVKVNCIILTPWPNLKKNTEPRACLVDGQNVSHFHIFRREGGYITLKILLQKTAWEVKEQYQIQRRHPCMLSSFRGIRVRTGV